MPLETPSAFVPWIICRLLVVLSWEDILNNAPRRKFRKISRSQVFTDNQKFTLENRRWTFETVRNLIFLVSEAFKFESSSDYK